MKAPKPLLEETRVVNLLNQDLIEQVKELFTAQLVKPVTLLYFYSKVTCDTCDDALQLLEEIASLSDKLHLITYELENNQAIAQKYRIDLTPSLVLAEGEAENLVDRGIHFSGMPSGYEFGSLIQAIIIVSMGDSGLKPSARNLVKELRKPVHLQVFVTPT